MSQHTTESDTYATKKKVSGATSSPNRPSSGISRKITAVPRLTMPRCQPPSHVSCQIPNAADTKAPIQAAILSTRRRLAALSA